MRRGLGIGDGVCEVTFTEFCEEYPLVGEAVRGQELDRVKRDLREFLEYDWSSPGARAYEAVERSFGFPVPFPLPMAGRELHVRGYIDRLDLEGGKLLVRDLKSGRPHPRAGKEEAASFGLDLQLALYGIVAKELADEWGTPHEVSAAYIYPRARGDLERAFHDDWPELESKGREWLTLIVKILEERAFVRTPDRSDCRLCAFKVVCSDADVAESGEALGDRNRHARRVLPTQGWRMSEPATKPELADGAARRGAIFERTRNVVVDAGAGTGKTTLLVERFLELVAPTTEAEPISIDRIAAVTFTRRASGHLRLSIRERVLAELGRTNLDKVRRRRLYEVLGGLESAHISTTHSFADRLLRLRPVEARLAPDFQIAADELADGLIDETFETLLHAAETGTLSRWLVGSSAEARAAEAERTLLDAIDAGVLVQSRELEFATQHGLSSLVRELILQRDLPPNDPAVADFDDAMFRLQATGLIARIAELDEADESLGARWFRRLSSRIDRALESSDPLVLWRKLATELEGHPGDRTKKRGFGGAANSWALYRAFDKGTGEPDDAPIRGRLLEPLVQWMARRLIRLAPVVVTVYERVKAARGAVDQIDLLLKLRNLLLSNLEVRGYLQSCFDHILVDEFQDTDPLQAEIVLYLCEDAPKASDWRDIEVAPGRLTLVGDPKQSIYRFRRADVAMYDEVRRKVLAGGSALEVELVTCFRSTPALIEWGNQRFAELLGTSPDESLFDGESGVVYHRPLSAGRTENVNEGCAVRAISFGGEDKLSAGDARDLEARALASELREMVESGSTVVEDPDSGIRRPVSFGDIAVLTIETFSVARLFPAFDAAGIPYASVGGTLFLRDPLHRQFLLALRALADRSDGIALAAILRPPFFAVDPADLLAEKAGEESPRAERARLAKTWIREQRRDRFSRSPGQMARNLLDETGLARTVALGPNGTQRLRRLRELCLVLEQTATSRHLDWDGVTALLREWVDSPIALDPPLPTDGDAVRVMTIHQAKGLEFPVVALWDSRAPLRARSDSGALRIDRHGRGWQLALKGLTWEEPAGLDLKQRELRYRHAERRRLIYVAATRARDLLILPQLRDAKPTFVAAALLGEAASDLVVSSNPSGLLELPPQPQRQLSFAASDVSASRWTQATSQLLSPKLSPTSVTAVAKADDHQPVIGRRRHGPVFGDTVHLAISLCNRRGIGAEGAVAIAARATGLTEFVGVAIADTSNALAALQTLGLPRRTGPTLRSEYPIFSDHGSHLISGTIDLLAITPTELLVIDFKTDPPPRTSAAVDYPTYCAQVALYLQLVMRHISAPHSRGLLLFTATGELHPIFAAEDFGR